MSMMDVSRLRVGLPVMCRVAFRDGGHALSLVR